MFYTQNGESTGVVEAGSYERASRLFIENIFDRHPISLITSVSKKAHLNDIYSENRMDDADEARMFLTSSLLNKLAETAQDEEGYIRYTEAETVMLEREAEAIEEGDIEGCLVISLMPDLE